MRYINQLEHDVIAMSESLNATDKAIQEFRTHLYSDKYFVQQEAGERVDWIGTRDVLRWLRYIENARHEDDKLEHFMLSDAD